MVEVRLSRVTKRFGDVYAVREVDLVFPDKGFTALLGPSGSGKTTLLYLIAGIYRPTSGRIYFDEKDVTNLYPNERNVSIVFQNYALYPHMKVFDNIAFPLRLRKESRQVIERKVLEIAEMLGISQLLDRYPSQLSGGQQQRVALARALVKEPSVLLLDEPLSNLDALLRIKIRSELKRLQKDLGITAIYVTHDQSEAMAMADKIVVIHKGVVQQVADPDTIYNKPRNVFVASFIGNPPANLLRVRVAHGNFPCLQLPGDLEYCVKDSAVSAKLSALSTEEVILAFRPEHALISENPVPEYVSMEAEVYTVEPLGRENIVTLVAGADTVKVIVPPVVKPRPGSKVYINVEWNKVLLFDPATEVNIEYLEVPGVKVAREANPQRLEADEREADEVGEA